MFKRLLGAGLVGGALLVLSPTLASAGPVEHDDHEKILFFEDMYGHKYSDLGEALRVYRELMGFEDGEWDAFSLWLRDRDQIDWG